MRMTPSETKKLVAEILAGIAPEADISTVAGDADLREALDLDSIDFLNLVTGLHERTGRPIPEADYPRLFTLDGIARYFGATAG
jgi:acyl carrier protein